MILDIVQPKVSNESANAAFRHVIAGSVIVAIPWDTTHTAYYYEGGIYDRQPSTPPTRQQREEYAKIAAGRAKERYPTVARLVLPNDSMDGMEVVGYVDTDARYEVRFIV
jgi:hypothetical protein